MNKLIKNLKQTFSKQNKETANPLFKISVETPYSLEDIEEFVLITGITLKEAEMILYQMSRWGISNLKDVITLSKMGYLNFSNN